jgi:hypothetical protein
LPETSGTHFLAFLLSSRLYHGHHPDIVRFGDIPIDRKSSEFPERRFRLSHP